MGKAYGLFIEKYLLKKPERPIHIERGTTLMLHVSWERMLDLKIYFTMSSNSLNLKIYFTRTCNSLSLKYKKVKIVSPVNFREKSVQDSEFQNDGTNI